MCWLKEDDRNSMTWNTLTRIAHKEALVERFGRDFSNIGIGVDVGESK